MSQFALKCLALLAMLLDHTAKVVMTNSSLSSWVGLELSTEIRTFMVVIGRMAFPVFAWFAAEGCRRSEHPGRRIGRLLLFALISELPFQLCFYETPEWGCHNVIFTMLLASCAIFAGQWLKERRVPPVPAALLPAAAAVALGWILQTDYNAWGVALILLLYYTPSERGHLLVLTAWITVFQLIWHGWNGYSLDWLTGSNTLQLLYWIGGMSSVAFLATYNGERGRDSKWVFYIFYPCHLLMLFGLSLVL